MWTNETETYDTQSEADLDGVIAWITYLSPALLLPVIVVDAFLIVTLVMKGPLPKVIRISLVNILVSCIAMACGHFLFFYKFQNLCFKNFKLFTQSRGFRISIWSVWQIYL